MKSLAVLAGLLVTSAAYGQARTTITATVTPKGKDTWTVSGVVTNPTVRFENIMVYVRSDGQAIGGTGPYPVRVGQVWTSAGVRADGTFSIEFTSATPGTSLDVYLTTGGTYLPNLPGRAVVPIP